jgi:hypothetical protein
MPSTRELPPKRFAYRYPTLKLADIYATITYYLQHQGAVGNYLREQDVKSKEVRRRIEARQPARQELRERLLARRNT